VSDEPSASPTRESYADELVAAGFSDDGHRLRGAVRWADADGIPRDTKIEIIIDDRFPFAPPIVRIIDSDRSLDLTFHVERPEADVPEGVSGNLCLWENDWAVDRAPWRTPAALLARVAGWLDETAAGWPGDEACDLERYLPRASDALVLYRSDQLAGVDRAARQVEPGPNGTVAVTDRLARTTPKNRTRPRRKDAASAWVEDVGQLTRPLTCWEDVQAVLGDPEAVRRAVADRSVGYLLLRYGRGNSTSVLVTRVKYDGAEIAVEACESADEAPEALELRAGPAAVSLRDTSVAVIGCGAVGSFVADLLYRSGVRDMGLFDPERLRPGNVVRHLGTLDDVGQLKVHVVQNRLRRVAGDISEVHAYGYSIVDLAQARKLVSTYDIVLDATANPRATSLLAAAAQERLGQGAATVLSVCVQRKGDVVRVDRMPVHDGETYLPPLEWLDDTPVLADAGCGSPVAVTPPGAVLAAARLAAEVVSAEAAEPGRTPASIVEVSRPQPEPEFQVVGRMTSPPAAR